MEKKTPHYDLSVIQADVIRLGPAAFTLSAREGARRMGLTLMEMLLVIRSLERRMLYKSMTTHANHRIWQDVYHFPYAGGLICIKVSYRPAGGPPVISFKEKET